jgi:hypothetical protein
VKLLAVAAGEITQRLREPGFLILLVVLAAGTTYLAPSPDAPYSTLSYARHSLFGGATLSGTAAGIDFAVLSGFFCIFALGGGFGRDDRWRLSELLRAQPPRTFELVLGRVLASWALGAVFVAGSMTLLGVTLVFRNHGAFDVFAFARIYLLLALPAMCFVASLAVVLDVLFGKWPGLLVAAGMIGYLTLIGSSATAHGGHPSRFDFSGIQATGAEFSEAFGPRANLSAGILAEEHRGTPVHWEGLTPETRTVLARGLTVAEAACVGLLALAFYRRRAGISIKGAQAIEPQRSTTSSLPAFAQAPPGRPRGALARFAVEVAFRLRMNPLLACASAALFAGAFFGAKTAAHWIVAFAILLPLFWLRVFDDAMRPRSLEETLASLPGGLAGDQAAKFAALLVTCALPLVGLLLGNPHAPMVWIAATAGIVVEIAWLCIAAWVLRAELLALGVVALWWYVIAFNQVPAPVDYAGLWGPSGLSIGIDAVLAIVLVLVARTMVLRRAT